MMTKRIAAAFVILSMSSGVPSNLGSIRNLSASTSFHGGLLGAVLSTAAITGLLLVGSVTYGVLTSGCGEAREAAAPMLKGGANLELEMPGF